MTTPITLWTDRPVDPGVLPSGTVHVDSLAEALAMGRGCAVVLRADDTPIDDDVLHLLSQGVDVVTTGTLTVGDDAIEEACARGRSTFHHTGRHVFLAELIAATVLQAPTSASHIRVVEAYQGTVRADDRRHLCGVLALAAAMFDADPGDVETETTNDGDNPTLLVHGLLNGVEFYRGEIFAGATQPTGPSDHLPFGDVAGAATYAITVAAAKLAFDAVAAVTTAPPGILLVDPSPHYRPDDRLPA
jgi:hypothetical protein